MGILSWISDRYNRAEDLQKRASELTDSFAAFDKTWEWLHEDRMKREREDREHFLRVTGKPGLHFLSLPEREAFYKALHKNVNIECMISKIEAMRVSYETYINNTKED